MPRLSPPVVINYEDWSYETKQWIYELYKLVSYELYTLEDSAIPSVFAGDKFLTGGTTTITNLVNGTPGQVIYIIAEHAITITDGTNIFLNGSTNYVMGDTDTLTLIQKQDGLWYELARSNN